MKPAASPEGSRRLHAHKRLALFLAVTLLLLRVSRVSAEENSAGYRHEFYFEDDNRIKVETDSASFDIGLGSKVRLSGELVLDAISGPSPTGAPPQSKWPFPTYADYFNNQLFNNSQYRQLYDGYVIQPATAASYRDFTNQIPELLDDAARKATDDYHALTNKLGSLGTKVPLCVPPISDHRKAFSLSLPVTFGIHQITPSISQSEESDYISRGAALNYALALNNKNTTLSAGWSHNSDRVRDDVQVWEDKSSDDFLLGVTQLLTPKSYLTFNFVYGYESGYLSDPYRSVMFEAKTFSEMQTEPDASLASEQRPRQRSKQIAYLSWTQFVSPLDGSLETSYRFFHDSSEIFAHTLELRWHQKLGRHLVISPSFRYYVQSAAYFYYSGLVPNSEQPPAYYSPEYLDYIDHSGLKPEPAHLPAYYSSDYRLSEFQSFTCGVKVTWKIHKNISLDAMYMRYVMEGLDGETSPSAYPSANVVSLGARLWF